MPPIGTSKFLVVLELDSRQTLIVRARDTDHRRHERSQRIDPAIAFVQHDSWYIESAQCVVFYNAYLLLQVNEAGWRAAYLLLQLRHGGLEDGSNAACSQVRVFDFLHVQAQGPRRHILRQYTPCRILDHSPLCFDRNGVGLKLLVGHVHERSAAQYLQIDEP